MHHESKVLHQRPCHTFTFSCPGEGIGRWIHTRVPHDLMVDQLNQRIDHEVGHVLSSLGEWVNRTFLNLVVRLTIVSRAHGNSL